ncbi:PAS domain-containing protein [Terribacillus saccharophilus]|uniref:STAS domain-containing protein n=1 Tax=Terribacillus saccharophilus TaxID=361277 RepID=UPI003D28D0E7
MEQGMNFSFELHDKFVKSAIDLVGSGIVITDPSLPDNPIVYVNKGFTDLTQYAAEEILGKNCRFLQGQDTDAEDVNKLRDAITREQRVIVELKNYKKNGQVFWNELEMYPIYLGKDRQLFFIGVQKDVTERKVLENNAIHYLNEVGRLSTPIVPLTDNISVLPLIGDVDEHRINQILETVGNHVHACQEDYFILDLQGVEDFHSLVHESIIKLNLLLRTMGSELIVTGANPFFARDLVATVDFEENSIVFYSSVKKALKSLPKL